ncbi:MAG: hypothetical protein U0234_22565 [Sandaracinus sp.]
MTTQKDRARMPMHELIADAERRGIAGAEWMDRASLVRALDEADGGDRGGPLARARRLLGDGIERVVSVMRGRSERPSRPPPPVVVPVEPEPTTHAEPARAETTTAEVARGEEAVIELAPIELTLASDPTPAATPPPLPDLLTTDPSFGGLRVVARDERRFLVWRAPSARLAAIGRGETLTLRLVSIGCAIGDPSAQVVIETADEPGLASEGVRALPTSKAQRCVAAIGVGRGSDFVAIAHARVA